MIRKKKEEHWSFAELRKRLSQETEVIIPSQDEYADGEPRTLRITKTPDWQMGTVFLFEPKLKLELNEFFYEDLYPQVLSVFDDQPFQIPPIDKIDFTECYGKGASCKALFIITDPNRPMVSQEKPWWYIRFNLTVSTGYEYHLEMELILSLPFWVESDWALDFMIDSRGWGIPPTLGTDKDKLLLMFSSGQYGCYSFSDESESNRFTEPFKKHLEIAKAIDRFSESPDNRFLKSYMLQVIKEFYGRY
jgi:hypothetical protein